jgi:hypothetical protein
MMGFGAWHAGGGLSILLAFGFRQKYKDVYHIEWLNGIGVLFWVAGNVTLMSMDQLNQKPTFPQWFGIEILIFFGNGMLTFTALSRSYDNFMILGSLAHDSNETMMVFYEKNMKLRNAVVEVAPAATSVTPSVAKPKSTMSIPTGPQHIRAWFDVSWLVAAIAIVGAVAGTQSTFGHNAPAITGLYVGFGVSSLVSAFFYILFLVKKCQSDYYGATEEEREEHKLLGEKLGVTRMPGNAAIGFKVVIALLSGFAVFVPWVYIVPNLPKDDGFYVDFYEPYLCLVCGVLAGIVVRFVIGLSFWRERVMGYDTMDGAAGNDLFYKGGKEAGSVDTWYGIVGHIILWCCLLTWLILQTAISAQGWNALAFLMGLGAIMVWFDNIWHDSNAPGFQLLFGIGLLCLAVGPFMIPLIVNSSLGLYNMLIFAVVFEGLATILRMVELEIFEPCFGKVDVWGARIKTKAEEVGAALDGFTKTIKTKV